MNFSKAERDEFVMETCQIACFHLPLPQSNLNYSVRSCHLETRASTERITATWGDSRGCRDWQLGGTGDCPGESNLFKQPGNAALGEPYSHDEPLGRPQTSGAWDSVRPGSLQTLLLQFLEIQQEGLQVESHVPSSRSFQFYSDHSKLSSPCRKIRYEPA